MPPNPPAAGGHSHGSALGGLTQKVGFQPLWAWLAEGLGIALAYALWRSHQAANSPTSTTSTSGEVPDDQVPDVIIQNEGPGTTGPTTGPTGPAGPPGATGKTGAPPVAAKTPKPAPKQLTRNWTSEGGSTLAAVAKRLGVQPTSLTPSNAAAKAWIAGAYKKNPSAKMPKGLTFTYTEGSVTPKK